MDYMLDFHKVCRMCCEEKLRMLLIFEQDSKNPLDKLISDVLRLEVVCDDGLPQQICRDCIATLTKLQETIENFRANDYNLRRQLGPINFVEVKEETMEVERQELEDEDDDENFTPEMSEEGDEHQREDLEDYDMDEEWIEEKPTGRITIKATKGNSEESTTSGKAKRGRRKTVFEDPNRPRLNDFKCYICKSDSMGSAEALIAHLNSHTDELPYTCQICVLETAVITTVSSLNVHKRMHENPHKCPYCDRRYSNKRNISLHVQMYHMAENAPCPSTCSYCDKVFPTKQSLANHEKIHTKAVSCEYCGKIFVGKHKLQLHIQRKHERVRKYECHLCHKKLNSLDAVQVHIRIMHSDKEYNCKYCPRTYTSELSLRYHEKKHEENPSYKSTNNWKQYYTFVEGAEGIKDGVRLKKCGLCGTLTKAIGPHLSAVHFPKEFRCGQCDMTFKRKNTYDAHVFEHEYGKAYSCPICGRGFSEKKNLLIHLKTKKHRDHPMAQSLEWLNEKSAMTDVKSERGVVISEDVIGEEVLSESALETDDFST
ncbi:zinc finger protein 69-like [Toxorhynchites rutilus septentrionalis]|uniref:zinc finger protein 69-like n=1 Tax=Toxorhynchites rutilus septentrionalis TaxID=329112 RepID=UPI00247833D4|nr:zinc finger protein 69-like [Toxorhynchites rutilus septentrionalis]